jgi:SHS family lactate transporter-like MFS transporter
MSEVPWWREPTRAQWCAFGAAWAGWVLDAFDFTVFMLVMPNIARDFHVATVATAGSITLTLFARLAGGFVAGAAADRWGRRLPLMVSIVWFAACDGAVALAPSFAWILVLRTLFGLGMGAEWTSGTTLAMENWPARSRGIASGLLQGSWAIGYLLAAGVSAVVLPAWGWRALFVCAALPAILVIPIRFGIVESDEWKAARAAQASRCAPRPAFDRANVGKVAWASAAMALGFGAYYSLTALYPTLLQLELGADARGVARLVALFNVGMLAGSVACGLLASRRGVATAIALPATASVLVLPLYVGAVAGGLPLGAFATGALGAGFCGVVPMLLTGMFDAEVRARMVGIVYHVGAALAALVPTFTAAIAARAHVGLGVAIFVVAGACELALAALVLRGRRLTVASGVIARTVGAAGLVIVLSLPLASCSAAPAGGEPLGRVSSAVDTLEQVTSFGANPGNLLMFRYAPASMPAHAPLVVMLHGCTQTASDFSAVGIDALADQFGFYLVYPQQQEANNPDECFDWFGQYNNPANKANITRGQGENESIKEMVDQMKADFSIDASRVYVIGFSSGAAMAAVMMAAWPDVFAAGGIDAGIPYNCPSQSNSDVFTCMNPGKTQTPAQWSAAVRAAYPSWNGPWPRASIWQGTQDTVVSTTNSVELVKQWTDLHGLGQTPTSSGTDDGQQHDVFADSSGNAQVERWQIAGMSHGFAIDTTTSCGTPGSYIYDEHICTVRHMIAFFGLAGNTGSGGSSGGGSGGDGGSDGGSDGGGASGSGGDGGSASSSGSGSSGGASSGSGSSGASSGGGGSGDGGESGGGGSSFAGCSVGQSRDGAGVGATAVGAALLALAVTRKRRRNEER